MRWYFYTLKNYAKFSGRATRKEYWIFTLFNKITFWSLIYLASYSSSAFYLRANITLLYIAIFIVPTLAVEARRLHDSGKTGWWQLLNLVPFGGAVLLVFCIIESDEGENQYGPNPHSNLKQAI
ncbi:DUF805 domain-containing protein [Bacillus tropicus]|uniref:DUF805 domain-containing protein n=1 Tax=Bacillus shihchuchen TaxID=3036942 RepID=A0ABT7KUB4_9BACI|nr:MULTISPECIES: DUF805 domain-containing protein [Bacillus]MDL2417732.1 DUF805 domain-containing protein [Bacillus shihchuchen]OTX78364.1 DUF805 domain-containing protein [Bacillus thuringiensis serovar chanpaisis]PNK30824.1 DUF805 domain-containing protein [Bacillus thuringiensis]MED3037589.1 DUF805 domain-containing protein [Bacillus tropicus]WBO90071.1 DUF805 domain-containing protein [Bacillus tropicus]